MKQLLKKLKSSLAWNDPVAERLYFVMVLLALETKQADEGLLQASGELLWDETTLGMATDLGGSELKYGGRRLRDAGLIELEKKGDHYVVRIRDFPEIEKEAESIGKAKPKKHAYTEAFERVWKVSGTGSKWNAFLKWEKLNGEEQNQVERKWPQHELYQKSMSRAPKHLEFFISGRCYEQEWTHKAQKTRPKVHVEEEPEPIDDTLVDAKKVAYCREWIDKLLKAGKTRAAEFMAHGNVSRACDHYFNPEDEDDHIRTQFARRGFALECFTTAETEELMKHWMERRNEHNRRR